MRQLTGIFYLILIVSYLLRPALPYIMYISNKEYIERNLCVEKENPDNDCHGKCYLHEQIKKQSEPQENTGNEKRQVFSTNRMDDHLRTTANIPSQSDNGKALSRFYIVPSTRSYSTFVFIPPKFIAKGYSVTSDIR